MHYLSRRRLERAAALLSETDLPVASIGVTVGVAGSSPLLPAIPGELRAEPAGVPPSVIGWIRGHAQGRLTARVPS